MDAVEKCVLQREANESESVSERGREEKRRGKEKWKRQGRGREIDRQIEPDAQRRGIDNAKMRDKTTQLFIGLFAAHYYDNEYHDDNDRDADGDGNCFGDNKNNTKPPVNFVTFI